MDKEGCFVGKMNGNGTWCVGLKIVEAKRLCGL